MTADDLHLCTFKHIISSLHYPQNNDQEEDTVKAVNGLLQADITYIIYACLSRITMLLTCLSPGEALMVL